MPKGRPLDLRALPLATGVLANSYRQDVIANNLANAETVGFKKDLALFTQRSTAAEETLANPRPQRPALHDDRRNVGRADLMSIYSQGPLQETGNSTDAAIEGNGFFMVQTPQGNRLTRDGRFLLSNKGNLVMAGDANAKLLDESGTPIQLDSRQRIDLSKEGELSQSGRNVAEIGDLQRRPDDAEKTRLQSPGLSLSIRPQAEPAITFCTRNLSSVLTLSPLRN